MGQVIAVVSGKGGTGKTSFTALVGSALAEMGHRTLCLDCDVGLRNLDLALGMSDSALMDFTDVIAGRATLEQAAVRHPYGCRLYLLTAPIGLHEDIRTSEMKRLLDEVRSRFDYCLIDSGAGLGDAFRLATCAADRAVVDPREIQRRMATIHIDVDPAEIGKNMEAAIPLVGDVKVILRQILDRGVPVTDSTAWLDQLKDYRKAELNRVFPRREGSVFPGTLLRKLGAKLDDDAVVSVDVGQNQIFTCKYLPQKHGRLLTSGGLGTMGYALPAGIGAKIAAPERQNIVVCGDGSFQMAMNELAAIKAADLDVKIVLFQNNTLGLVHQIQKAAPYHGPFGVALDGSPDFSAVAGAYGIPSLTVDDEDKVDEVLDQFLAARGCCLLIVKVHPDVGTND